MKDWLATLTETEAPADPVDARVSLRLRQVIGEAAGLLSGLPVADLDGRRRRALWGQLWDEGPGIAHHVGRGLLRRPELFPELDAAAQGGAILERQERARGWRCLAGIFEGLAAACRDNYLYEEATAIKDAKAVLDRVEVGAATPELSPGLDHRGRGLVMLLALLGMERARRRNAGHRMGGRQQKKLTSHPKG